MTPFWTLPFALYLKMKTKRRIKDKLQVRGTVRPVVFQFTEPKTPVEKIMRLMEIMASVKTDTPEAQLNATSISDNNGGRILL